MKYLLGIDNGGTFSKAALFDENGNQISMHSAPTTTITPKIGYVERNMDELWEITAQVIRKTIEKSNIDPNQIKGVSFSGHGKGLYMVDYNGNPAYNAIASTDTRAWEEVKKWYENGVNIKVYEKTYQEILVTQPVSLLSWIKKNKKELLKNVKYIFSVKDYIRYKITGVANGEYSDFSGSNLINLRTKNYDIELMSLFDLEDCYDKLPPLKHSIDVCGYVIKEVSEKTLLPEGTPVSAGMFDVNACGIASGLINEKEMCMIAGTWSINEYISKKPILNGTIQLNSFFCIPDYYLIEESSPTSAGNMQWFIEKIMNYEKENVENIYELTNEMVESIEPQDTNVIFLPFLNGSNVNPLAKATFIGLTSYHEKKHMLRAVYEGIVFSHITHIKRLLKNREKPKSIKLSGGAANSDVWVQMFADSLQIPIDVIENKEMGAQGAAISAGIAIGVYEDYESAIKRTVKITKTIYPRLEYKEIYEKKYNIYKSVIENLNSVWDKFGN
ncbi:FGGY-family carbohydrate kinase [Oceanivirga salmonicida]|uniref:FGGY-family carbohydrate kinase n=1 Tax=Oceanivirga salmonicida TaxID=1769291 RepID=UPI00082EA699|nr:FGGY-family carbohydrate kinase [Oceanivirga salmonicida]